MALAAQRSTPGMAGGPNPENLSFPIKDNVKVYKGSIVVLDAGYAKPGVAAASLIAIGRAEETVDNTIAGHATGLFQVPVKQGVFKFANSAGDAVTAAEVGATCYVEDDQTVCKTTTGKSAAGKVVQLDSDGVWVRIGL